MVDIILKFTVLLKQIELICLFKRNISKLAFIILRN